MKEKIYIIFKNNEEEYEDYSDWIIEIYKNKERAENRFVELVKTNQYKKDRAIRKVKYNENIGAYRIEEHEIESEKRQDEVIDTNSDSIEEDIKYIEEVIALAKKLPAGELNIQEKEIETMTNILSDYKKLKEEFKAVDSECSRLERKETDMERENEELKATLRDTQNSWFEDTKKIEKLKAQNKELETQYLLQKDLINSNDYISKQKIKDKIKDLAGIANKTNKEIIEELKSKDICQEYLEDKRKELRLINRDIKTLQSLLEESEDSENGEGKKSTNTSRNTRA